MRSDSGDRVLDGLDPALAEALSVAVVVERQNLVLEERVDGSCVELILIALVLVCALLLESPAGTLAVALNPPSVKYGEIDNTVHLSLLA